MRQFWVVAGICLIIISLVKAPDPSTAELSINKIERLADAEDGPSFNVCYNENEPNGTTLYTLIIKSETSESLEDTAAPASAENCVKFTGDITQLSNKDANFLLNALNEHDQPLATGQAAFVEFPDFPDPLTVSIADDPLKNDKKMLRVNGSMNGMEFTEMSGTLVSSELISYYLEVDDIPKPLQPCTPNTTEHIVVCDVVVTAEPLTRPPGPNVTSGLLSYGYNDGTSDVSAKLEFEVSSVVPDPSHKFDIILPDKLCPLLVIGKGECEINWAGPGMEVANIRLIGVLDNLMQEAILHSIPDRELIGEIIGTDTYEARWLILPYSTNDDDKHYMLTKKSFPEDTDDEIVYVDCSNTELHHCFGYFPGIKSDTYRITVQDHKKSEDYMINVQDHKKPEDYNGDKKIQSEPFTIPPTTLLVLEINKVDLEWQTESSFLNASVCFLQNDGHDLSSYQLLFVNQKGQWRREDGQPLNHQTGLLCFPFVTLDTQEFDINNKVTVTVMKRSDDGRQVLASGQISVNFPTLNALRRTVEITRLTWELPEEGTFLLRQDSTTTSKITCKQCFYDVNAKDTGKVTGDQLLTMEILDSPINITLKITSN